MSLLDVALGSMIVWLGVPEDVPAGFALCDGSRGTVDLSGFFEIADGEHGIAEQRHADGRPLIRCYLTRVV